MNSVTRDAMFDELNNIGRDEVLGELRKEAVAGFLARGFGQVGSAVRDTAGFGKAVKYLWRGGAKAGQSARPGGVGRVAKGLAPGAAAVGLTGAGLYGAKKAVLG